MANLYDANGVIAWEHKEAHWPSWLGVSDEKFERYKLTFFPSDDGTVSVGACAAWRDQPSEYDRDPLADYTSDNPGTSYLGCDDVLTISDDGLLTVMRRSKGASFVDFRSGFTLQLPVEYVEPVRQIIAKAWEMAAARKAAKDAGA